MEFFTPGHLIVIAIVALVLFFGWKQLPDMARSVGRSLRVFKTEIKGMGADDKARKDAEDAAAPKQLDAGDERTDRRADARTDQRADEPAVLPQADVVRRPVAPASTPAPRPASAAPPARNRPRPTPSPNGRAHVGK